MNKITITLTEDQVKLIEEMLESKIGGLHYTIKKYNLAEKLGNRFMYEGGYGSYSEYEHKMLPHYKKNLAFAKRLKTTLAKAKTS